MDSTWEAIKSQLALPSLSQPTRMPIFALFKYLWQNNRLLLVKTFSWSYIVPILIEILPWFVSERKVGRKVGLARIKLTDNLIQNHGFKWVKMKDFIYKSIGYAVLSSLNHVITSYVAEQNNTLIKRLVLERILFAEVDAFQQMSLPPNFVEKITHDINSTLDFINIYLPLLFSSIGAFLIDGYALYKKRVDPLAVIYPIIAHSLQRIIEWAIYHLHKKAQKRETKKNNLEFDRHMSSAINSMVDIQANNLQGSRLKVFDKVAEKELKNRHSFVEVFVRCFQKIQTMSFIGYIMEVWCVHKIMQRQGMTYSQYIKIQQEIERVVNIGRQVFRIVNRARHLLKGQSKVLHLIQVPTFLGELSRRDPSGLDPNVFTSLILSNLCYTHPSLSTPTIDLKNGVLKFKPRGTYGIVGGDRVGTTLAHLICNIIKPQHGSVMWNGIEYSQIHRTNLRKMITYIPPSSFIIDGTIQQNLLLVSPGATQQELMEAILKSGLHHFLLVHGEEEQNVNTSQLQKPRKKKKKGDIIRSPSMGDIFTLVTPSGEVYQDSRATHFPIIIDDDDRNDRDNHSEDTQDESHYDTDEEEPNTKAKQEKPPTPANTNGLGTVFAHPSNNGDPSTPVESEEESGSGEHTSFFKSVSAPNLLSKSLRESFSQFPATPRTEKNGTQKEITEEELRAVLNIQVLASTISRGLNQAIGLARLFLRKESKVVILNDALDALDQLKLRKKVFPHIWSFVKNNDVCLIVVSKNHSTVRDLDCILVFDPTRGTIAHAGTHKDLLQQKAKLYIQFMFPWKISASGTKNNNES